MEPGNTNLIVGRRNSGSDVGDPGNYPVNLFVGSIKTSATDKTVAVYGDAYLLDPEQDSVWDGCDNKSALAQFVENNVNGANVDGELGAAVGGNIYCMNNSLTIGTGGKKMIIDGNLVFANKSGTLTVGNNIEVRGQIICSGTYVGSQPAITGDAVNDYIDTAYAYYNSNYSNDVPSRIETVEWDEQIDTGEVEYAGQDYAPDLEYIWNGPAGAGWYRKIYNIIHHSEEKTITNDYSLFPFAYRPDEIFERYYRWDLKQAVNVGPAETTNIALQDPLVQESIACGHNWSGTELMTDVYGNSYYVPYTFPCDAGHKLIDEYKVASPSTEIAKIHEAGYAVYDSEATFKEAMGSAKTKVINATGAAGSVPICYHDSDGVARKKDVQNAILVSESCVLRMSGMSRAVIDPSQRANKNVPLYIYLEGGADSGFTIVVNNTASYVLDETDPTPYYNDTTGEASYIAQHGEVVIFLDKNVSLNKACIVTSGLYGHMTDNSTDSNKSGDVYIVQNPVYPGDPNFGRQNAETDFGDAFKFAYELVPNTIILGEANGRYGGQNGYFWNAEAIMPTATLYNGTPNFVNMHPYYREEWDSLTKLPRQSTYLVGIGGSMTDQVGANDQWATIAYIGDKNRKQQTTISYSMNSSDLGADNKDYLHNNYQGAS